MRHNKHKKRGNHSLRRSLIANTLKALVTHGAIKTTVEKAKWIKPFADKIITLAKNEANPIESKRRIKSMLQVRFNKLTPKDLKRLKQGDDTVLNDDRKVLGNMKTLAQRFQNRNGGYTRLVKLQRRRGDDAQECLLEYLEN